MISVVIRTLNEARHLRELLTALRAQQTGDRAVETIVVDSGSTDGTLEIAAEFGCRVLRIDRHEFTFGRSLNRGCEAAAGEFLVFVSGHCIPADAHWLDRLVAPLAAGTADYSYGRQTGRGPTRFSEQQVFEKYFPESDADAQRGPFCNNANAALRRTTWAGIRFDESLTGLEDMMFAKELLRRGGRVAYVAGAVVYHIHQESWRQVRLRYEREALALKAILPELHVGAADFLRYFVGGVWHDWGVALRRGMLRRCFLEIILFRFMQFSGTYLGNREHRHVSARRREEYFYPRVTRTASDEAATDCPAAGQGPQRAGAGKELPAARR